MKNIFNVQREPLILLVSIGLAIGMLITGLAWIFPLTAKGLFTQAVWFWILILVGSFLTLSGAILAQEPHYPSIPKPILLLAVFAATALIYLFPELFAPGCNGMPRAFAACPAACRITTCSDWAAPGERGCNAQPPDKGCCFAYITTCDTSCQGPDPTPVPANKPPVITGTVNCSAPGTAGWCKGGGVLNLSASDPQGFPVTISGDIAGVPFTCGGPNCSQVLPAGSGPIHFQASTPFSGLSSAMASASFAYDPLPPTASLAISGTAGTVGWYKSAVVSTTGSDTTSGLASSQISVDGGAWQAAVTLAEGTHSVLGRATDTAGNLIVTPAQTVKVDATAPIISASVVSGMLAGSWFASNAVVKASATDDTSGVVLLEARLNGGVWIPADQLTIDSDGIHSLEFSALDNAGNSGSYSMVIRKDGTPPDLSISSFPDGLNGWYVTFPTLSLVANDATSGLDNALFSNGQATTAIMANGVYNLSASAMDNAGNSTNTAATIRVDTDPPVLYVSSPIPDGLNGWFVTTPTFSLTASDATSGLASALFGNGQPTMTIPGDGIYNVKAIAKDNAGNTVSSVSIVRKDSTPPNLSIPAAPDGQNGWYVTKPTLTLTASDASSGLVSALFSNGKSTTAITADGVYPLNATAVDIAGNTTQANKVIRVDTTPPTLFIPSLPDGLNSWYVTFPTLSLLSSDATSGLSSAVFSNGRPTTLINADGVYTLSASAADLAGNISSAIQTVQVDTTAPDLSISSPYTPDGQNGWYVTKPTLTLTAADTTSGLASAVFADGARSFNTKDGTQVISAEAKDRAGNAQTITQTIKVDTIPPTITPSLSGSGANGWYNETVNISLNGQDTISGIGRTEYRLDGGEWHSDSGLSVSTEGEHTVEMRVTDNAGNVTSSSRSFKVDTTRPVSAFANPPEGSQIKAAGTVLFTGSSADNLSGMASTEISLDGGKTWLPLPNSDRAWSYTWDTTRISDGMYTILVRAEDKAGNRETSARVQVIVGNKPPKVEIQSEWWLWESGYFKIQPRQISIRDVTLRIACSPFHPDVVLKFSGDHFPVEFKWDRLCGNGAYAAESRDYSVILTACDTFGHCAEDSGVIKVPFIAPIMPTWTPLAAPSPTPVSTALSSPAVQIHIAEVLTPGPVSTSTPGAKQSRPNWLLWTLAFLLTAMIALACAAALDPRPQALRKVGNTLVTVMQSTGRTDEQA